MAIEYFYKKLFLILFVVATVFVIRVSLASAAGPGGVSSGNTLWLRADSGTSTTVDGAPVATWNDSSGSSNTATGSASNPTYVEVDTNYNPSINFDGSQFFTTTNASPLGGNNHAYTKIVIFKPGANLTSWFNALIGSPTGNAMLWLNATTFPRLYHGGDFLTATSQPLAVGMPSLIAGRYGGVTGNAMNTNGALVASNATVQAFNDGIAQIGTQFNSGGLTSQGKIPEAIIYDRFLSNTELIKVQSYLGAKYGISIDQTTPTSYVASDGTTKMWDHLQSGASSYDEDIAVIGRDDTGGLNQKQSRSSNTDDILTIGVGSSLSTTNVANPNTFGSDLQFLSWGNDGGDIEWQLTGGPTGRRIISRTWMLQENAGDVGTVILSIPDNSASGAVLPIETTNVYALFDADGDFTSGTTSVLMTLNADRWEAITNIDSGTKPYMTFATETPSVPAPVFYLPFDGDYVDLSGNSNDGTNVGTSIITDGTRGEVASFNGTSSYVSVPTTLPTDFTKSAWVYSTTTSGNLQNRTIIGNPNGARFQLFWVNSIALKAGHSPSTGGNITYASETNGTFPTTSWQHVAVTYESATNTYKLYRNGVLVASGNSPTTPTDEDPNDIVGPTYIGSFGSGLYWEGYIDDAEMWDTALTDVQVAAVYTGDTGVIPPTPTPPDQPTGLISLPLNQKVRLEWTAPVFNGLSAITDYVIEYALSGTGSWVTFADGVSTGTSVTVTGLTNSIPYDFRVSAVNAIGTGSPSTTDTETPINVIVPAPIFYLPFDGDYTDASGNGNDGTNFSSAIVTDGTRGQVVQFDHGLTDYISIDEALPDSFTKSVWLFVPTGESMFNFHIMSNGSGNVLQNFLLSSASLTAGNNPGGPVTYVSDPSSFNTNVWTHVALTYDSTTNTYKLYKDGILIDTGIATEDPDASSPTTLASADGNLAFFWGSMDDAEMWNTVLDDSEIVAVYAGETGVSLTPSVPSAPYNVSAYPIDEGVELTWDVPVSNGEPITDYVIEYALSGTGSWVTFADGVSTGTSVTVTGLTNEAEYDFRISALNSIGASSYGTTTAIAGLITYFHVISTGQSLAVGAFSTPTLSTVQPYNNLMLPGLQGTTPPLIPLVEGAQESPSAGIANSLRAYDSLLERPVSVGMRAQGATSYTGLKSGTAIYNDILTQVDVAKTYVEGLADNTFFKVMGVTLVHGEDDQYLGFASSYKSNLEELQTDYENDINAITGSTDILPLFISQMNTGWSNEVAVAQYEAHKDNPGKIILIGPKYQYLYGPDHLHLTNVGSRYSGEMFAKVMKKVVVDGDTWNPLMPTAVTRSGAIITIDYDIPVGPLVLDTTNMVPHTNYGFEFVQTGGNTVNISNVQLVNSSSQVRITLDAIPTGTDQKVRYAYTCGLTPDSFAGKCADPTDPDANGGNLRDSDSSISPASDGTGLPLYNWGVAFEEPVTLQSYVVNLSVTQQGSETGPQSIVYTATLSQANSTGGSLDFDFDIIGGTADDTFDFTNTAIQISIPDGATVGTVVIPVIDDADLEGSETVDATISNPPSQVTLGTAIATATITDNDGLVVEFGSATYSDTETSGGNMPSLVVSGSQSLVSTTVEVAQTTTSGTAGVDFTFTSPVIMTIPAGNYITPQSISLTGLSINNDTSDESDETITFALANPSTGLAVGTQATTVYTILDDDSGSSQQDGPRTRVTDRVRSTLAGVFGRTEPTQQITRSPHLFTTSLKLFSEGEDVRQLQKFLNTHGFAVSLTGPGSLGNETFMFGAKTKAALVRFQEAHRSEILTPLGLTRGTGIFGPQTMKIVNQMLVAESK